MSCRSTPCFAPFRNMAGRNEFLFLLSVLYSVNSPA
jgi:hypothetical protein